MNILKWLGVLALVFVLAVVAGAANASTSFSQKIESLQRLLPDTSHSKIVSRDVFDDLVASSTTLIANHGLTQVVVRECPGNELVQSAGDQGEVQITMLNTQEGVQLLHIRGKEHFRFSTLYAVVDGKVLAMTAEESESTLRDQQAAIVASQFNNSCDDASNDLLDHIMDGTEV